MRQLEYFMAVCKELHFTRAAEKLGIAQSSLSQQNTLLPPAVLGFHRSYPNVELSVHGLRTGDIVKGLLQNELDLGVVYLPAGSDDLASVPLYEERFSLAAAVSHPLAAAPVVSLNVLKDTPSVLLPATYYLRQLIDEQCRLLDFAPQPILEMTTMESIIGMVGSGIAVTVLPHSYLESLENGRIRAVPIVDPPLTAGVGVVYRRNRHLCAASRAFLAQLKASAEADRTSVV